MANLKDIRTRITSVGSTMQITSAMKMVSAAKLKKAQDAITMLRPYSKKMQEILQNISYDLDAKVGGEFTKIKEGNKILIVVITSNRGLCGAFNSNIIKEVKNNMTTRFSDKEVSYLTIGKKGFDILKKDTDFIENQNELWNDLKVENVKKIADNLMQYFKNNEYAEIHLVYNQFKNAATQIINFEQLLPILLPINQSNTNLDYIYEPSKASIVLDLLPKTIHTQLYKAVLDSNASEHGARMTAMHKATDNADELRKALILSYNKARQAAITKEILEIVGGAEALEG